MYETATGCGCGCGGGGSECCALPPEFVRVRYYFGQRMGVMEFTDQSIYHASKHAFHNARLHGVGVVCGLRAERFAAIPGGKTTMLKVIRGVALDNCGHEIVVGIDQCVDVAAWFAKNRTRPELAGWTAGTTQTLRIAVRYRECSSDPGPAPRDACGCEQGGCENGRIREGFELGLFVDGEPECDLMFFPPLDELREAVGPGAVGGTTARAVAELVARNCPVPDSDAWLCLASVPVTLDGFPVPVDLGTPDNAIPERRTLLSTEALQALLLDASFAAAASGVGGPGPRLGSLTFVSTGAATGDLVLPITLARAGLPAVDIPLLTGTIDAARIQVQRLVAGAWVDAAPVVVVPANGNAPVELRVQLGGLAVGTIHRLSVDPEFALPIVDERGQLLQPQRYARRFGFVADGAGLKLDPSL